MISNNLFDKWWVRFLLQIIVVILISTVILSGVNILSQTSTKTQQEIQSIVELTNGIVVSVGILVGGIWAFYRVLRERAFASKLALDLKHQLIKQTKTYAVVAIEVALDNIGTIRILPNECNVKVAWVHFRDGKVEKEELVLSEKLAKQSKTDKLWYIEPGEKDYVGTIYTVPTKSGVFSVEAIVRYNKSFSTERNFYFSLG